MKACEHFVNLFGEVGFDVHTRGEGTGVALDEDDGDVGTRFQVRKRLAKFARHRKVDDVERGVDELNAGDGRRHIYYHSACGGGGHRSVRADKSVRPTRARY